MNFVAVFSALLKKIQRKFRIGEKKAVLFWKGEFDLINTQVGKNRFVKFHTAEDRLGNAPVCHFVVLLECVAAKFELF